MCHTHLPAIIVSDKAVGSIPLHIQGLVVEDVGYAPTLCNGSTGCTKKGAYPKDVEMVPISLLWRPDHPRTWDQGDVSITSLFVHGTIARPWLQVLGQPSWHNLVIEATVSNPKGCAQMLQPNITEWKGASGLTVKCN